MVTKYFNDGIGVAFWSELDADMVVYQFSTLLLPHSVAVKTGNFKELHSFSTALAVNMQRLHESGGKRLGVKTEEVEMRGHDDVGGIGYH